MTPFTVVNFHTNDPYYAAHGDVLKRSVEKFGLTHDIQRVPRSGSWVETCAKKAGFLKEMLRKHSRPIVWLDADAIVIQKPELFWQLAETDTELAYYGIKTHHSRVISATLYFGVNAGPLLDAWEERCTKEPRVWDQIHLADLLTVGTRKVEKLPESYCRIFDAPWMTMAPVILQTQASRQGRRLNK